MASQIFEVSGPDAIPPGAAPQIARGAASIRIDVQTQEPGQQLLTSRPGSHARPLICFQVSFPRPWQQRHVMPVHTHIPHSFWDQTTTPLLDAVSNGQDCCIAWKEHGLKSRLADLTQNSADRRASALCGEAQPQKPKGPVQESHIWPHSACTEHMSTRASACAVVP